MTLFILRNYLEGLVVSQAPTG